MPSTKTSVLPVGELNLIINWMLHNWAAKCIATLGANPGPGAISAGQSVHQKTGSDYGGSANSANDPWVQTWDGEVPDWGFVGEEIPEMVLLIQADAAEQSLAGSTLIRFDIARQEVEWASRRALLNYEGQLARERSYRAWTIIEASKTIMTSERIQALSKVFLALLPKRNRSGRQVISTRRRFKLGKGTLNTFNGKPAWRGLRGRPPLPESTWRNRYMSRLAKRRKGNKTKHTRNRGAVKVPATLRGRPPFEVLLGEK